MADARPSTLDQPIQEGKKETTICDASVSNPMVGAVNPVD
jgi:hypothetical protein